MAEPTLIDLIGATKTLLESVPSRKFKVLNPEEVISFDNGENPDVLRSTSLDSIQAPGSVDLIGRVNAWIIRESGWTQTNQPMTTGYGGNHAPLPRRVVYRLTLEYFYDFNGGLTNVRNTAETVRQLFNANPRLGLAEAQAQFIDQTHGGLQLVLAAEGDFRTAIAFIRVFTLDIPVTETS